MGATLYALLAGRPPFVADQAWKVLAMVAAEEAPALRTVLKGAPGDLDTIVMKCLERDPAHRYESARAVGEDLERFLDGEPVKARRASPGYVLWKKAKKHKLAVLLASAVAFGAAAPLGVWIQARRDAAAQMAFARSLGEDIKEMELFLRNAYALPLHDVEKERDIVRARLAAIENKMAVAGNIGQGPGHYALGRGYLALQEPEQARAHLEQAVAAGYTSPELEYALGQALGALYKKALEDTKRIENKQQREAKVHEIEISYRDPALAHLAKAGGASLDSPAYAQGLIAFYSGNYDEALAKAKQASEQAPWLYEANKLAGDAQYALGSRFRQDAAFDRDKMMAHFGPAAEAYRAAAEMARSDPEVHRAECELWTQIMLSMEGTGEPLQPTFEKARDACERAVAASSKDRAASVQRAFAYEAFALLLLSNSMPGQGVRGSIEEAIRVAEEAVRAYPEDAMANYVLGGALSNLLTYHGDRGDDVRELIQRATVATETALRIDPRFTWALNDLLWVDMIRIAFDASRGLDVMPATQSALEHSDRLIAIDAEYSPGWNGKGNIHNNVAHALVERGQSPQQHVELALAAAEELKRLNPGVGFPYGLAGVGHAMMAMYELQAGQDPRRSLEQAAQSVEELRQRQSNNLADWLPGFLWSLRARYLVQQGKDPERALHAAREAFQNATNRAPWDILYRVGHARVEILALRWAMMQHKVRPAMFDAAFAPLRLPLAEERANPYLYQALAEIHALRAEWRLQSHTSAAEDIRQGLAMAEKALSINPRMATAFIAKASLHLTQARAAREPSARTEAARLAQQSFEAAFQNNPLLKREHGAALRDATQMQ